MASKDGFIVLFVHTHRRHFSGLDLSLCKLSQASYGRIFPVNPVFFRLLVHFSLVPRCQLRRKEDFYCFGLIVNQFVVFDGHIISRFFPVCQVVF